MIPPRPSTHVDPAYVLACVIVYGGMVLVMAIALIGGIHVWRKL